MLLIVSPGMFALNVRHPLLEGYRLHSHKRRSQYLLLNVS